MLRLFLYGNSLSLTVKLNYTEALRIVHIISENCGSLCLFRGSPQSLCKAVSVEDVVSKYHRHRVVTDKFLSYYKGLRKTVGRGLHLIAQAYSELVSVSQEILKPRCVRRCGYNKNVLYARIHKHRQRIIYHRLVIYGQKLL